MSEAVLNRGLALAFVKAKVEVGVQHVSTLIEEEAKRRAPVRKTRKYDNLSNRETSRGGRGQPLRLGYFLPGSDRPLRDDAVLALLHKARAQRKAASERDALMIGRGKASTPGRLLNPISAKSAKNIEKARAEALPNSGEPTRREFLDVIKQNKIELRPIGGGAIRYQAKHDISLGRGVTFTRKGAALYGGNLKRSIRRVKDKNDNPLIIHRTIRSHAPYSKYVEYPTSRTEAQPFLRPAYKQFGKVRGLAAASRW